MEDLEQLFQPPSLLNWFSANCWECHKGRMLGMSESEFRLVKPRTAEISKKKIYLSRVLSFWTVCKSTLSTSCIIWPPGYLTNPFCSHICWRKTLLRKYKVSVCMSQLLCKNKDSSKQTRGKVHCCSALPGEQMGAGRRWNWICWICVVRAEW